MGTAPVCSVMVAAWAASWSRMVSADLLHKASGAAYVVVGIRENGLAADGCRACAAYSLSRGGWSLGKCGRKGQGVSCIVWISAYCSSV